jgi:exodeoxyribonuclease VII small subunit
MSTKAPEASPTLKFEDAMKELEAIVARLEKGDLPLDESLAAFQRGVELARLCDQRLAEAEQRVAMLTTDENRLPTLRTFEDSGRA